MIIFYSDNALYTYLLHGSTNKTCIQSFPAFLAVAFAAQHLAVVRRRATLMAPRHDVVGLHLLNVEILSAYRAHAQLPLTHPVQVALTGVSAALKGG